MNIFRKATRIFHSGATYNNDDATYTFSLE